MYNPSELCMILLRAADLNLGASISSLSKRAMTDMHKEPHFTPYAAENLVQRKRKARATRLQKNTFLPFWGGCYLERENA